MKPRADWGRTGSPAAAARWGAIVFSWLLAASLMCAHVVLAAEPAPPAYDPALEAQVQRVASQLRCLVCQNQSLADSHAELAQDLRREVREMLAGGKSEAEVREFMVARYGDYVLYQPPFKATTLLLWLGPFALLIAGAWGLARIAVGRRRVATQPGLNAEEEARLRALLAGGRENEAR